MRIAIDLTPIYDHLTGVERYNINITRELILNHPEDTYVLLFKNEVHKEFTEIVKLVNVEHLILQECNKLLFMQVRLLNAMNRIKADYYLFLSFTSPFLFKKKKSISAIHDLTCWDCPETIPIKMKYYYRWTAISLPLVLHGIALNILSQSDRTMITWLADASQTGIYSLIYNFSMVATVITTSLDGLWIPFFMEKLRDKEFGLIDIYAKKYIAVVTAAMFILILVGPEIVKILVASEYWDGITIIPPIVLSNYLIFCYTLYVTVEHFYKKTKNITLYTVIAAVSNLILNYLMIPQYGYIAAAYTTLCSYFIALFLHALQARKLNNIVLHPKMLLTPFFELICCVAIFYIFQNRMIIRWCFAVVFFVVILFKYQDDVKPLIIKGR